MRRGLDSTLTMLGHRLRGVQVGRDYAPDLPVTEASAGELNQVWTNLIANAADALGGQGQLQVRAVTEGGSHLLVEIVDSGPGIPEDVQAHIFDPFFTTKGVGEGSGLGLDIARRIVQGHRGKSA
ncbi:sensor histidine kinase [Deinococcus multiflagellatus]|uniref:histidine kinase n=1 Tax=Deinococcus multiflagellatus TaxID=1656887 RepID=A0ABW1ZKG2_9DEIO